MGGVDHFIFVPVMFLIGAALGFIWGSSASAEAHTAHAQKQKIKAAKEALEGLRREE